MFKIPNPEYTREFRELAVKRVKSGQTIGAVARELGLVEQTLRNWVKAAERGEIGESTGCQGCGAGTNELLRLQVGQRADGEFLQQLQE